MDGWQRPDEHGRRLHESPNAKKLFTEMNYWRGEQSSSRSFSHADRVSADGNEIVDGRDFTASDIPTLALLVSWHQVVDRCMEDIGANGGVQVAYQNDMGDNAPQQNKAKKSADVLQMVISDRRRKEPQASGG